MTTAASSRARSIEQRWTTPVDLGLATCLVLLAIFTVVAGEGDVKGNRHADAWWEWILLVTPAVPIIFRRSAPFPALAVSVTAQLALWGLGLANPFIAPLVMIYTVCADGGDRGRKAGFAAGLSLVAMSLLGVLVAPDVTFDLMMFTLIAVVMAFVLGSQAASRRAAEVRLAETLAITRVETEAARASAAADERQRIARELHDIVGHSLSIIAVQAEAADRVAPKNPNAAVDAVGAIAATARSSLADVRRVLAGLRSEDADVELAPVPSLDSLDALATSFSDAGLDVSVIDEVPHDSPVAATVGAGAYRIVQEALTNVLKHGGPTAHASLQLSVVDENLVIRVDDDGRGPAAQAADSSPGIGLTGMRERAEVLGGDLQAGPRPGGGYQVVATLPVKVNS